MGHELGDIARIDAAAILDPDGLGCGLVVEGSDGAANGQADNRARSGRRGRLAGADSPDRLVGDDHLAHLPGLEPGQTAPHLAADHLLGPSSVVLGLRLADTNNAPQPVIQCGPYLAVDALIGLAKVGASFRMALDDVLAQLFEHRGRDFACEGALFLPVHVLRAQADICGAQHISDGSQGGERGTEHLIGALDSVQSGADTPHECHRLGDGHVHLPVSGHDRSPHFLSSSNTR